MTPLVTVERYRVITGDSSTAASAASAAIEDATALLSEDLGRPDALDSRVRTETMTVGESGRTRPLAVPVTVADGYTFDTAQLYGASPDSPLVVGFAGDRPRTVSVVYTGGFVERTANPSAANRLPEYMERDLAWAAHALLRPGEASLAPAGATSVSLGDASVSYGPNGAGARSEVGVNWSRRTRAWRRLLA